MVDGDRGYRDTGTTTVTERSVDREVGDVEFDRSDLDVGESRVRSDTVGLAGEPAPGDHRPTDSTTEAESDGFFAGLRRRVRRRLASVFRPRTFLLNCALALVGVVVIGGLLPFGSLGQFAGVLSGTFLGGLVSERRAYFEAGLAGATVGAVWAGLGNLLLAAIGLGVPIVAFGAGGGALAAALGHYFGRDLRHGLTRDL